MSYARELLGVSETADRSELDDAYRQKADFGAVMGEMPPWEQEENG
jgi:hypothetical protein